jgi:hypothetical protein
MKLVKFTWYPGADANTLKLRHDNRIQGLDWQRLTDAILALKQAGFVETVSRSHDDDKLYTFRFNREPTMDNVKFCQHYIEANTKPEWYGGMQLSRELAERFVKTEPPAGAVVRLLQRKADDLQRRVDEGAINYREAFDALASSVRGTA